ncbi:MAG: zinc ribbon domain-containing protein [Treponema sp.]|nr:zinc ribbon domain-containing protein [Treponema sp.]
MPTYGYECDNCSHNFEIFQAMSDDPLKKCPQCGKKIRRLISGGAGVIFKGSGFYVTDKSGSKTGTVPGTAAKPEKPSDTACPAAAAGGNTSGGGASPCSSCPKNKTESAVKSA